MRPRGIATASYREDTATRLPPTQFVDDRLTIVQPPTSVGGFHQLRWWDPEVDSLEQ